MNTASGFAALVLASLVLTGCASVVPLENVEMTRRAIEFSAPSEGHAGVYIYRINTDLGAAWKKDLWVDGQCIGESASGVFFYTEVTGDQEHTIETETEYSSLQMQVFLETGKNYFFRQNIEAGNFVGSASLIWVHELQGMMEVENLSLAISGTCSRELPKYNLKPRIVRMPR